MGFGWVEDPGKWLSVQDVVGDAEDGADVYEVVGGAAG